MIDDVKVVINPIPMEWKCIRCRQHLPECAPEANNYGLCFRCQDYMHVAMNSRCVSCGGDDAKDNLCFECRAKRIADYDANVRKKIA